MNGLNAAFNAIFHVVKRPHLNSIIGLDEATLKNVARMTPHLTRLNLSFCGRMTGMFRHTNVY